MPQPRLSARKLKRIFALFEEGQLNRRQIARRIGISCSTLWRYLGLYFRRRIRYPNILDLNDREFFAQLLPHKKKSRSYPRRAILLRDMFPSVAQQLVLGRANLRAMWAQYFRDHQDGYRYSQYVAHFKAWQKATGQWICPPNRWHINHIPEKDMKVLKAWRRSSDRRQWERAVAIMDLQKGSGLTSICSKIERSRGVVKRWIAGYLNDGLAGVPPRQMKELSSETISHIEEKKHRLIEILHQSPSLYNINRTSWSLKTLAETYKAEYGQPMSKTTISAYVRLMGYPPLRSS
jgi:transposase